MMWIKYGNLLKVLLTLSSAEIYIYVNKKYILVRRGDKNKYIEIFPSGSIYLRYNSLSVEETKKFGYKIVDCLSKNNINYEWDGCPWFSIKIKEEKNV